MNDVPILLVEDDQLDVKCVERAFRINGVSNPVHVASNGEEAMDYLNTCSRDQRAINPCIILLDINMPVMNGIEFLTAYKAEDRFRHIPAVVLTTSREDRDRLESYKNGIAGYIVKPVVFSEFCKSIEKFKEYWTMCELPCKPGAKS